MSVNPKKHPCLSCDVMHSGNRKPCEKCQKRLDWDMLTSQAYEHHIEIDRSEQPVDSNQMCKVDSCFIRRKKGSSYCKKHHIKIINKNIQKRNDNQKKFSKEEANEIYKMLKNKVPYAEIRKKFDANNTILSKIKNDLYYTAKSEDNAKKQIKRFSRDEVKKILKELASGITSVEMCKRLKIAYSTLAKMRYGYYYPELHIKNFKNKLLIGDNND